MLASLLAVECIAFKAQQSGKYVSYMREYQGSKRILQVSGEHTKTPYTRFHPEPSTKHRSDDGYYHIKSLYNNRYWVAAATPYIFADANEPEDTPYIFADANEPEDTPYIFVDANEPEEDVSKPSCTLFRIELDGNNCKIFHAHTNECVSIDASSGLLCVGNRPSFGVFKFKLISMPKFVLPEYVCFNGDNGKYLRLHEMHDSHFYDFLIGSPKDNQFMQFSGDNKYEESAIHIIETNDDGTIRVKNHKTGKYWRLSPSWIWADSGDTLSNDTLFLPFKLSDGNVALKCLGNSKFCRRLTKFWEDCLSADVETFTKEAQLQVEEPVLSRTITVKEYHLEDAKVVSEEIIYMTKVINVNRTSEPWSLEIPIKYCVMDEKRWDSSTSSNWKITAELNIGGKIPIVDFTADLNLLVVYDSNQAWGTTHKEEIECEYKFHGIVPVNKKVKVHLKICRFTYDVPFSYRQEDCLANGELVTKQLDDGLFHGVKNYVKNEATEEEAIDV